MRTYANSPAASSNEARRAVMATRKRWSRTVGTRRGNRIRIYQRAASGNLQMAVWDPEKDRKSTRLNSSHQIISYAVFCLKKKKKHKVPTHAHLIEKSQKYAE